MHFTRRNREPRYVTRASSLRGSVEIRRNSELGKLGAPLDVVSETRAANLLRMLNDGTAVIEPHRVIGRRITPVWLAA